MGRYGGIYREVPLGRPQLSGISFCLSYHFMKMSTVPSVWVFMFRVMLICCSCLIVHVYFI